MSQLQLNSKEKNNIIQSKKNKTDIHTMSLNTLNFEHLMFLNGVFFKVLLFLKNWIQWYKILEENRCKFYECEVHVYDNREISLVSR